MSGATIAMLAGGALIALGVRNFAHARARTGARRLIAPGLEHLGTGKVLGVLDGDTITVGFEKLLAVLGPQHLAVRLLGGDAPELRGPNRELAEAARDYLDRRVHEADVIELAGATRAKYEGRVLARVVLDGVDVMREMIEMGLARPYDGGPREAW